MSSKNSRKNLKQNSINTLKKTLDIQHNGKLIEFHKLQDIVQDIKLSIFNLDKQIQEFKEKQLSGYEASEEEISSILKLKDEKECLKNKLYNITDDKDEIDYYVNTAPILFQYYDVIEKGTTDDIPLVNVKDNNILKFFMNDSTSTIKKKTEIDDTQQQNSQQTIDRASLLEKYLLLTDDSYIKNIDPEDHKDRCVHCGCTSRNVMINEGIVHCNSCDAIEYILIDHDRPSYKDPPKEVTYFSYKRINHLNEWISQIQGKETTDIPEEIYDKILLEIKKQKITNMAVLTRKKIREILRKLDSNKYYEHIPHIINKLNGLPIPNFEPELEEKLRVMFKMIQPLFLKYAPASRKNFLSYSYCLHKFVQLLGRDEYLSNLPLLKSRDKLQQQDAIWKKICDELNWQFIRSL